MKKIFYILHGLGSFPSDHWFLWLKGELEKYGSEVILVEFPNPNQPSLEVWLKTLEAEVSRHGVGTLIGHSLGGTLAMRYVQAGGEAERVILVAAPNTDLPKIPDINGFVDKPFTPLPANNIHFVVMYSTDDPVVPVDNAQAWETLLGVRATAFANKGHFGQLQFPEIIGHLF